MITDRLLRVNEVAEILRVSQMTVIRWCNSGHLPCVKIGVSRRIKESDLDYILKSERGPQKLKVSETESVYEGPPADECGFDSEADEEERRKKLKEECEAAKTQIEAMKDKRASTVKAPEPVVRGFGQSTGMFVSGFDTVKSTE